MNVLPAATRTPLEAVLGVLAALEEIGCPHWLDG